MWFQLTLTVPPEVVDPLTSFLDEQGSSGQEIKEESEDRAVVVAYFDRKIAPRQVRLNTVRYLDRLLDLGMLSELPQVQWADTPEDWKDTWKQYFKPIEVTPRLVIRPSWEPCSLSPDQSEIIIDPKVAFGTGHHETTRICLRAEEALVGPGNDVLDVGTGTGILCIRAVQLGAKYALGLDNDAEAIEVAQENLVVNGVQDRVELLCGDVHDLQGSFDLIVSNIRSSVLTPMLPAFARLLVGDGKLVLSGILADEEEGFCRCVTECGFQTGRAWREGEWIGLTATKEMR